MIPELPAERACPCATALQGAAFEVAAGEATVSTEQA